MLKPAAIVPEEQRLILLSSLSPGPAQKRLALAVVLALLAVFVLITAGPLSGVRLGRVDAFVPAYAAAMFVCDSITAILLYVQFSILRSRAILVIASGYLFTGFILIPFVLVFPGVFVPGNLMGGPQSTSWVWCFWHAGFPMFVIGYALLKDSHSNKRFWRGTVRAPIALSVASTVAVVSVAAFVFIAGEARLPRVTDSSLHFSSLWPYFIGLPVAVSSASALIVLWVRRRSMLDLWLIVVICLYLIEVPLSYYPDPNRFSFAWYTVRVIGFIASVLVLIVLLYEITTLYSRLLVASLAQRREREARRMTGDTVAAAIAHEVKQPLTAMITSADAGLRFLDRAAPNIDRAKEAFKRVVSDGHRAGAMVDDIRADFRSDEQAKTSIDVNELIRHALALEQGDLQKHGIWVQAEPNHELPEVRGNQVQLQQVLLNLIGNAIDAMAAKDEPRVLFVKSGPYGGDQVVISVADTGPGVGAHDAEQIFTPLYTTKSNGMGMGLSICRAIIEAHNGRLWVTPNTPQGAVFQFTLRATSPASAVA
jgi:signal transduction histidine kinase